MEIAVAIAVAAVAVAAVATTTTTTIKEIVVMIRTMIKLRKEPKQQTW